MPEPSHKRYRVVLAAAILLIAAATVSIVKIRSLSSSRRLFAGPAIWYMAQDDQESDAEEVKPEQVEKYVKVYQSMQRDRTLSVEQAAAREHLTVAEFRDIEGRIERDGVLRERVRRELLKAAEQKSNALKLTPQSAPSPSER
jgi:hypothetical protein